MEMRISAAIAIPDTGFDELPTIPTILDDTVTKKNPKINNKIAPIKPISICGKNINTVMKAIVNITISHIDRKSTRLNSSHVAISYAVFCLKKKKKKNTINHTEQNTELNT